MLVTVVKWKDEFPNRKQGNTVLVVYSGMKKADYRIRKVEGIKVDAQGNMRTLEVERRHRDRRTDCRPEHKGVEKDMLKVWVQRTALIMPVGEYGGDGCKESEIDAWTVMTAGVGMSLKS